MPGTEKGVSGRTPLSQAHRADAENYREKMLDVLRTKYDGYRFSKKEERIYNPFSLFNVFDKNELGDYWFESGTPTFMVHLFEQKAFILPDLEKNIRLNMRDMNDYRLNYSYLAPLLFQAGYLTIKDYDREENTYILGYPNDEVK